MGIGQETVWSKPLQNECIRLYRGDSEPAKDHHQTSKYDDDYDDELGDMCVPSFVQLHEEGYFDDDDYDDAPDALEPTDSSCTSATNMLPPLRSYSNSSRDSLSFLFESVRR